MKIAQIKGASGAGKTTMVKQLLALDPYLGNPYLCGKDGKILATINPNIGWAAIGKYDEKRMGGCDRIRTTQEIKDAIAFTLEYCLSSEGTMVGIVFEGMMISTIKSTFYDFVLGLVDEFCVDPYFVILNASVSGCTSRIAKRGTKGLRKGETQEERLRRCAERIERYQRRIMAHAKEYDPGHVRILDVESTPEDEMVIEFLSAVDDVELLHYAVIGEWE